MTASNAIIGWLIVINLIAFLIFGYDKALAGVQSRRIPERTLLVLALAGGSVGAYLGMQVFRHKIAKKSFQVRFWIIVVTQIGVSILAIWILRQA